MINAVGNLFSKVSSALTVNQATLSGCIDVIVVDQGSGTFKSTPFHVRFGKFKVLKSKEKTVTIEVNGVRANFTMKLGSAGEAYFEQEIEVEESKSGQEDGDFTKLKHGNEQDESEEISDPENYSSGDEKEDAPIQSQIIQEIKKIEEKENLTAEDESLASPEKKEESLTTMSTNQTESEKKNYTVEPQDGTEQANLELQKELMEEIKAELPDENSPNKRWSWGWGRLPQRKAAQKLQRNTSVDKIQTVATNEVFVAAPMPKEFNKEMKDDASTKTKWYNWDYWRKGKQPQPVQSKSQAKELESSTKETQSPTKNKPFILKPKIELEDVKPKKVPKTDVNQNEANDQPKTRIRQFLRPTNEMIKSLNLKPGANQIKYTVYSPIRGNQFVVGNIYLLHKDCKIVISDIDGTITRSDVLGQLVPMVGKDWSHKGVANLFNSITNRGYCILYLTARAIGQSNQTRNYLNKLNQKSWTLPPGPVIMSPDRLIPSFKREVIHRKPEIFKIACLKDIKRLFPPGSHPFFAGFGNRETDAISYRAIGIKMHNIFLINPKSEIQQLTNPNLLSYDSINSAVKEIFPPISGFVTEIVKETLQEEAVSV